MAEEYEVSVRTISHPGFSPAVALARLKSYTPGRACFVLESLAPDTDEGRYSIVGYRVRQGASLPPAADVSRELGTIEAEAQHDSFAQALALASVGYIDGQVLTRAKGVRLHEDMTASGVFAVRSAVMVYDHHEDQVHVAGRVIGKAVERLIWELEHGPEIPDIDLDAPAPTPNVNARIGEKRLKARGGRVQSFLGDELEAAVIGEELVSSVGEADGLDIYRALTGIDRKSESPHSHAYYVDFGKGPFSGHIQILGLSRTTLHRRRRGEDHSGWSSLEAALPREDHFGTPPVDAARVLRDIEDGGRVLWGAAVGYACPGGESAWMLAEKCALLSEKTFICSVGVRVDGDTDCTTLSEQAHARAADPLAALAVAQAHAVAHPRPPEDEAPA